MRYVFTVLCGAFSGVGLVFAAVNPIAAVFLGCAVFTGLLVITNQ